MTRKEGTKKKYIRNGSEYNERLVRRGKLYITLDFTETWIKRLRNRTKERKADPMFIQKLLSAFQP